MREGAYVEQAARAAGVSALRDAARRGDWCAASLLRERRSPERWGRKEHRTSAVEAPLVQPEITIEEAAEVIQMLNEPAHYAMYWTFTTPRTRRGSNSANRS